MTNNILMTMLLVALLFLGCSEEKKPEKEGLVKTVNVETTRIKPQTFERFLRLVGTVNSDDDVQVSAEVSGRVERFYVRKGDQIKKGAPILKIDDSKLMREQSRLEAQTEQARERYQRLKRIFEQDSIGSEIDLINAKTTYEERKSALESLNVDANNTTVRAPFSATLDGKLVEVGEMASTRMPLVRLIGSGNLKIVAGVPSRFSNTVSQGDTAQVWFDYQKSDTLRLPLSYVGQSIDKNDRTFKVEINLPQKERNFKVDMIANVKLRIFKKDSSVVIGEEFIYRKNNRSVVFTVAENDSSNQIAKEHTVRLGSSYQNNVVIEDGLNIGDELITAGSSFLQDSMRIKVVKSREKEITQKNISE